MRDVLPPLTEWDSMLTQCSYRVFQQQKLPDTLSFDRPVYLLPKAKLKGRTKCPKSQHKKCRYPLNKGFTYQVLLKAAHQGNQWGYVETPQIVSALESYARRQPLVAVLQAFFCFVVQFLKLLEIFLNGFFVIRLKILSKMQ